MHTVLYTLEIAVFIVLILALCVRITRVLSSTHLPAGAVVLVTGGSRGLGLAIASRFAGSGWAKHSVRLVLASRHLDGLQQAQATLRSRWPHLRPEDFLLLAADLAIPAECQRVIDAAFTAFGRIDVLVNNAGIIEVGPAEIQPTAAFERAMQVNFFAAFHTSWAALPRLRQQVPLTGTRRAAIVNIASVGGKMAVPHMLPYTAAKFALVGFSEGLHAELHKADILVTTVCPGLMRTGGEDHAHFIGNVAAERRWFMFAAKTPGIATTVNHAANTVFRAVQANRAEITITPQAFLATRFAGLFPETLQFLNAVTNRFLLPGPPTED